MYTTVTELLRNFPKIRRAALSGQRVVIHTREGDLVLSAARPAARGLFGSLAETVRSKELAAEDSGADTENWRPSL